MALEKWLGANQTCQTPLVNVVIQAAMGAILKSPYLLQKNMPQW